MYRFPVLLAFSVFSLALVPLIAALYSYSILTIAGSGIGFIVLAATAGLLWLYRERFDVAGKNEVFSQATPVGIALGLLWVVEIGINNFIAPTLPQRDIIDNIIWAVIALAILALAIAAAYRAKSFVQGIRAGAWSGFVSGLLACCMALSLIVFGMRFIVRDPLNIAEWEALGRTVPGTAGSRAPTMAAYFAYETFAGAFLHLLVLGLGMGGLLGVLGGLIGKAARRVNAGS